MWHAAVLLQREVIVFDRLFLVVSDRLSRKPFEEKVLFQKFGAVAELFARSKPCSTSYTQRWLCRENKRSSEATLPQGQPCCRLYRCCI